MKIRYVLLTITLTLTLTLAGSVCASGETTLVQADGTYPVKPLEKDVVVLKVVQNGVKNLQDFDDVQQGLKENLEIMAGWVDKACNWVVH